MNRTAILVGGLGLVALLYYRQRLTGAVSSGVEDVQAAVSGWASVNDGPVWLPVLNVAESQYGIPTNLLARVAYQESRFRPQVIDGSQPGGAGELGIMQLMPSIFSTVNVPVPFSAGDTGAQIAQAGQELARLYNVFGDWGLAVAAYNDGQGHIQAYLAGQHALPTSTAAYVAAVFADVPVAGATLPG